jgi:hypothetical protein
LSSVDYIQITRYEVQSTKYEVPNTIARPSSIQT